MPDQPRNAYLEGDFGPVAEELTLTDLPVSGTIPEYLDGRYLRNGPNPLGPVDPARYNWFLGDGMVHGLRLRDGKAEWYRNRYVRSREVARKLGEAARPGRLHAGFDFAANTHVIGHAGRTLALVESGPRPYELDEQLDTVGICDFEGTLPGGYTAHPLLDPDTGELHAVSYYWGWGNRVQYSVIDPAGRVRKVVDIPVQGSPMMHAFSLTEEHVIVFDLPVTFDARKVTSTMPGFLAGPAAYLTGRVVGRHRLPDGLAALASRGAANQVFPYSWDPSYPARLGVFRRDGEGRDIRWFEVEPCYVYHPLNAYDAPGGREIVIDVTRHPKTYATDEHGPYEGPPTLDRWTIDLAAGKVIETRIDDQPNEFPRVDERLVGKRHRYGYAVALDRGGDLAFHSLLRYDVDREKTHSRSFGSQYELDEFVPVAPSPEAGEGEGVLMGFGYDRESDRSELLFVDAGTLETVATVALPCRVPHGFHGSWIPA